MATAQLVSNSKTLHFQCSSSCCTRSSSHPSLRRPPYFPGHILDPSYVQILDTTLRDGEQASRATMNSKQKLKIARQLAKLGVDIIDAGFPSSSKDDFETMKSITEEIGNNNEVEGDDGYVPVLVALCRCMEEDIRCAWEAVRHARRPRIVTFIATSDIHLKYKLNKTRDQVVDIARNMVMFACCLGCTNIAFGVEDAAR